jgi:Ca-activated chloride channel family protein
MSKFEVVSDMDDRYLKTNAIPAPRIGLEIQKVPMSISVIGEDFLRDAGSTNVTDLHRYQKEGSNARMTSILPHPVPPVMEEEPPVRGRRPDFNTEAYDRIVENAFLAVQENPLSTFSIDVDTASYANMRRFINAGQLPPKGAVRIEELINYFSYDYPEPEAKGEVPFSAAMEVGPAPWKKGHQLVRIGLRGESVSVEERPKANLVFLLDVSGSMNSPNKLPLVKQALKVLVEHLQPEDRVAIAVYAGASGLVLPSTPVKKKGEIFGALERLSAGGSTNGGMGIQLAYDVAKAHFVEDGVNRVILCTDGDFNVGTTNQGDLIELIEEKAKTGTFLTVLGFGMGNYKDSTLEKLADHGNGNYGYVDSLAEAKKLLGSQIDGTLVTIAKDVKIQVEFNPASVKAYRLIGYENRVLAKEDFNDDTKDAGEIGAGHTVTALYEIVPMDIDIELPPVDLLKYQTPVARPKLKKRGMELELLTLKLRYKEPAGDKSELMEIPLLVSEPTLDEVSKDFKFAAAVAGFGMLLRDSDYKGDLSLDKIIELAGQGLGTDEKGERMEFLSIVKQVRDMQRGES